MKTINKTTIKHDLCINCGICKIVCEFDAIKMERNKYGELTPIIDFKKCKQCGQCANFCPQAKEKLLNESLKISKIKEPHTYGLQGAKYYLAWDEDKNQRLKCCSGGAVTKIAQYLIQKQKIDGMIHVERLWGKLGDLHYSARLSKTIEEIKEHTSSAYQPIDFSEVLMRLEQNKTYLFTGTPCVIRGIKKIFECHKRFKSINIITCALICSHNTNSQFIDYFAQLNKIDNSENWKANIRHKDETLSDANNFKNYFYTKDKDLFNKNRFESGWTNIWRNYYFAMNACLKCSDFWGYEADISAKDAWGEWAVDPLGKSIVIIRNKELQKDFENSGIIFQELSYEKIKEHQKPTAIYKQGESYNKHFKSIFCKKNRKNSLLKYTINAKISKFLYKNLNYRITKNLMKIVEKIAHRSEKI